MKQRVNLRSPLFIQHTSLPAQAAATNYYLRSQELNSSPNSGANVSKASNIKTAPDGTNTAETLTSSTDSSTSKFHVQNVTLTSVGEYTYSAYVKSYGERYVDLLAARNSSPFTNWALSRFDLMEGAVVSTTFGSASIEYINSGWYRISVTGSSVNSGSQLFRIALMSTAPRFSGIIAWGVQVEQGELSSYIATTSSSASRSATTTTDTSEATAELKVWNGNSSYNYDRINVFKYNKQLTNAVHVKQSAVAAEEDTNIAPDGSNDSDSLTSSSSSTANKYVQQVVTTTETGFHTFSTHVKSKGVDEVDLLFFRNSSPYTNWGLAKFNISQGTVVSTTFGTARIQDLGNDWYRISVAGNVTSSGSTGARISLPTNTSTGDGVYIWGSQLELGTSETTLIETTSSATTFRAYEDESPSAITYSLSNNPSNGLVTFEISSLIGDYIEQTTSNSSGSVWAKVSLSDGVQIPKEYTFLSTEGYISSYEPIQTYLNAPKDEVSMQSNDVIIIPEGESLSVPIYAQYNSYYTITNSGSTSSPIYFSNLSSSSTQIEYVQLSSDDTSLKLYVDSILTETLTVQIAECSKYANNRLMFVNKSGAKQEFFVNMKSIEKIKIKDSGFNRNVINYDTLTIDNGMHGYKRNVSETREMFTLNTPFLDEGNVQAFEELLLSEYVWLSKDGSDYLPVTIKDNSMTRKTHLNDKLIQYTVSVESSFNLINNQR